MKISKIDNCVICQDLLIKKRVNYKEDLYDKYCEKCPSYFVKWPTGTPSLSYSFRIRFNSEKCELNELVLISFNLSDLEIEIVPNSKFGIWKVNYEPYYTAENILLIWGSSPNFDFDNFDKDKFLKKIKTYILFS